MLRFTIRPNLFDGVDFLSDPKGDWVRFADVEERLEHCARLVDILARSLSAQGGSAVEKARATALSIRELSGSASSIPQQALIYPPYKQKST